MSQPGIVLERDPRPVRPISWSAVALGCLLSVVVGRPASAVPLFPATFDVEPSPASMVTGDFNGDAIPDFAIQTAQDPFVGPSPLKSFLGDAYGRYHETSIVSPDYVGTLSAADVDSDGRIDLVSITFSGGPQRILWFPGH